MKHSALRKIIKEIAEQEIGAMTIDPATGIKTTFTGTTPETGKLSWDVDYNINAEFLYNKLDQLVDYLMKVPSETELGKIKDIIKNLKNKAHRLIKK